MNVSKMCEISAKEVKFDPEKCLVHNMFSSAMYVPEYVSSWQERSLMDRINAAGRARWTTLSGRRVQRWGGAPEPRGMIAEILPPWLASLATNLPPWPSPRPLANHVLINEYLPGQGIMPHLDGDLFYPIIATISLNSHTILRFKDLNKSLLLEPRSLLLLTSSLYTDYMHYIEETESDIIDETIMNLALCSDKYSLGSTHNRDTRISLTIRHVPKTSSFKLNIGK